MHAIFVGDGETGDLVRAIAGAGLQNVRVHGYSPAARRIAAAADALVLSSLSEGQPIAVLEAFQDGTLVVVSDIPELKELVDDGVTGVTFAADDAGSLAGALARIAAMPEAEREAIRRRAGERHRTTFSTSAMVRNYLQLYHLARRARPRAVIARPPISPAA